MNDTAVVTGGSRGIGLAISKELASAGFRLAIIYAGRKEAAVQAAESLRAGGTDAQIYACDVADTAEVRRFRKQSWTVSEELTSWSIMPESPRSNCLQIQQRKTGTV